MAVLRQTLQASGATLLVVDFADALGWRRNVYLDMLRHNAGVAVEVVPPDAIVIDGKMFDPTAHFATWRERQRDWMLGKTDRQAQALQAAFELRDNGLGYAAIAAQINKQGLLTPTGKHWTVDNLRKALRA